MTDKETKVAEVEEKLEDITECSICCGTYKEPKILPCIHTFCLACLQQTCSNSGKTPGDQMPCPMCRKEFLIPVNGYHELQRNFFMERLTEIKQLLKPSDDPVNLLCDECMEGNELGLEDTVESSAEVYCTDCCQKLCSECHRHHRKSKATKQHKIIGLDVEQTVLKNDILQNICLRFCEVHKQKPLELYCHDCQTVVCALCFVECHKCHDGSDVNKVSDGFRQEIQRDVSNLSSLITDVEQRLTELEISTIAYTQYADEIEIEMNKKMNELMSLVEKDTSALIEELKTLRKQRLTENIEKKDCMEMLLASLQSYRSYCKQITTAGSSVDVCREVNNLHCRANELIQLNSSTDQSTTKPGVISLKVTDFTYPFQPGYNIIGKLEEHNDSEEEVQCYDEDIKFKMRRKDGGEENLPGEECERHEVWDLEKATSQLSLKEEEIGRMMAKVECLKKELKDSCDEKMALDIEYMSKVREVADLQSEKAELLVKVDDLEKQVGLLENIAYGNVKPTKPAGNVSCDKGLCFSSEVGKLASADDKNYRITGIAILENELFVSEQNGLILVHDLKTLKFKRRFHVEGLSRTNDMKQCNPLNCLFMMKVLYSYKHLGIHEIFKVDPNGNLKGRWSVGTNQGQLSVTSESNVLFTVWISYGSRQGSKLEEYTSEGHLMRTIPLSWNSGIERPWHAVKLTSSHYAVSHGDGNNPLHRVCIINADGIVLKYYGEEWNRQQLNCPYYMDVDGNGNILVADRDNSRIVLLSCGSEFKLYHPMEESSVFCRRPTKIFFDECYDRAFVVEARIETKSQAEIGDILEVFTVRR